MNVTPERKVQYRRLGAKWPKKQATSPITRRAVAIKKNGAERKTASVTIEFDQLSFIMCSIQIPIKVLDMTPIYQIVKSLNMLEWLSNNIDI